MQEIIRNPDDKTARLIKAVGDILSEEGYRGLGVNKVALKSGVSKPMIYHYFGGMNGLIKAYIAHTDSWIPYFASLGLSDEPEADELQNCISKLLQDQFRFFRGKKEMQKLVHWQISEPNPLMHSASMAREAAGQKLINLTGKHFKGSPVNLKAVLALLVGGIYFNVLHDAANAGTVAGMDLKSEKDFKEMLKAISDILGWAFAETQRDALT